MMTNAQAALLAAASIPRNPNAASYGSTTDDILTRSEEFKRWLDSQDEAKLDAYRKK